MIISVDRPVDPLRLLSGLSRALAQTAARHRIAEIAARHLVPALADGCLVDVGPAIAVAHRWPETTVSLRALGPAHLYAHARAWPVHATIPLSAAEAAAPPGSVTRGGAARGRLLIWRESEDGRFTRDELDLARACGEQLELALAHAATRDLDETARAEAQEREEELSQKVAARDQFLSAAAHELRTPLTALILQVEMIARLVRRGVAGNEERVLEKTEGARAQLERLSGLIDRFLDVTRISAGRLALDLREHDLAAVVNAALERVAEQARRAHCPLVVETAPVTGHWDGPRLEQLAACVLSNAFTFGAGAPVEIRVIAEPARATLEIRDHGIGIDRADAERIFEQFVRLDGADRYGGGLGVGLYVAREIARAHGGEIEVDSAPGEGARFSVVLPRDAGHPSSDAVPVEM